MNNTLVFIHGSGDSGRIWRLQEKHFGREHTFALDLPGHGERADTLAEEATVEEYAQAVHEIISNELGLERPIIAGHSLGGAIALMLGLEHDKELGGLILMGTGARLRVHPDMLREAKKAPERARRYITELCVTQEHVTTIAVQLLQESAKNGPEMLYRDLMACDRFDVMARLHEISIPTMIICGNEDRLTPPKYSHFLHKHLSGIEHGARLHIFPQAGHYVMREQPEMVNRAIEEWMSL
jgi:pimeloyl-ACP methyl ester carboxylesterase